MSEAAPAAGVQNPANDEAGERPGEAPGERAQRLYEQAAGSAPGAGDAGPGGLLPADEDQAGVLPGGDGAPSA